MNKTHGITTENLLNSLPEVLRNDKNILALATSIAEVLSARDNEIRRLSIYPRIDELPADLVSILAHDFKVDWWDENYTLDEKRATLKSSWRVHRILGTAAAVKIAISAIYDNAQIQEWWQYGGEPYHFRLKINSGEALSDYEKQKRVIDRMRYYKNLRSVFESIQFAAQKEIKMYIGSARQDGVSAHMLVSGAGMPKLEWLFDESDNYLTDETGSILFE